MIKIFPNSKIYFVSTDYDRKYMGFNCWQGVSSYLNKTQGLWKALEAKQQLISQGYFENNGTYYILAKAVPMDFRRDLRNDNFGSIDEVLAKLKT